MSLPLGVSRRRTVRRPLSRLVAVASVIVGCVVMTSGSGDNGAFDGGSRTTNASAAELSSAETRVAGISVERTGEATSSSTAPTTSPSAPAPSAPAPSAPAPPTTAFATTAPTATAPTITAQADLRTRVLARIAYPWETELPGWRIEFLPERPGYRGSTFPKQRLIQIYRRDGLTLDDYVHVTAHEIGHAIDVTLLDDDDHERWNLTRGRDADAGWWVASGEDDFSSGAGDWAECFAWSQLPSGRFYSTVGPVPTEEQLAVLRDIVG